MPMEREAGGAAGPLNIDFAPMEGVTGWLFRQAHRHWFSGVDRYFMPFLSPRQEHAFTRREASDFLPEHNRGLYAVPQLLTRSADDFLWAAGVLADLGYREVNLNLGCPSGTVVAKGKGSGLLGRREELERLLDGIYARAGIPVSIKTRLGLRDPEEFFPLLELFNRYPVCELIIHPRVQKDFYRGAARWEWFELALGASKNPLCYNGDLLTAADCRALESRAPGLEAAMLGRGLVASPDLIARQKGGPALDKESLRTFHDQLYHGYCAAFGSERNAMLRMKEVWFYLIHRFRGGERHARQLRKAADPRVYEAQVASIFRDLELREEAEQGW